MSLCRKKCIFKVRHCHVCVVDVAVNRLKEETGVLINIREEDGVSSNIIRIEGNREGVLSVKKKLQEIVTNLENEKVMNIDHRFFPSIIGTKGDKIREIKELYSQVQIIFPHPGKYRMHVSIVGGTVR